MRAGGMLAAHPAAGGHAAVLASALHDLRQPLCALRLYGQAMALALRDAGQGVQTIASGWMQALHAFDQLSASLLDLAWAESGQCPLQPCDVLMDDIFDRLRRHLEPEALERGLLLRFHGGHRRVWADPLVLERLLRNLIVNALKCTADGGVIVTARQRSGCIQLQVWDSGPGLPQQQTLALQALVQQTGGDCQPEGLGGPGGLQGMVGSDVAIAQAAGNAQYGSRECWEASLSPDPGAGDGAARGHGLGLRIVAQLAGLMGARLRVDSRTGRGSVFSVLLPQRLREAHQLG